MEKKKTCGYVKWVCIWHDMENDTLNICGDMPDDGERMLLLYEDTRTGDYDFQTGCCKNGRIIMQNPDFKRVVAWAHVHIPNHLRQFKYDEHPE